MRKRVPHDWLTCLAARMREAGAVFYDWNAPHSMPEVTSEDETLARLVTSWSTTQADVEGFAAFLR